MKKLSKAIAAIMLTVVFAFVAGCKKDDGIDHQYDDIIKVTTLEPTEITHLSAVSGGSAEVGEGYVLSNFRFGICWSKERNPKITDNCVYTDSLGISFEKMLMFELEPNTKYYARAFAVNFAIIYGNEISFTTLSGWESGTPNEGYLNGIFSVADNKRVRFAKGNLQYMPSTNTWRFADNQWDLISEEQNNAASATYNNWIDALPFGASGWYNGNIHYLPYEREGENRQYLPMGYSDEIGLTGAFMLADFGVYNAISNGGNQRGLWRMLTNEEWNYLRNERNTPSGIRFANVMVNGLYGVALLPDNWVSSTYSLYNPNSTNTAYDRNTISLQDWAEKFEANGAVLLPSTNKRIFYHSANGNVEFMGPTSPYAIVISMNPLHSPVRLACDVQ